MSSPDTSLISWSFALAALGYVLLAGYLVSFGSSWRASLRARRIVIAAGLSVLWACLSWLAVWTPGPLPVIAASVLDVCRYGMWYAFLLALLSLPAELVSQSVSRSLSASFIPRLMASPLSLMHCASEAVSGAVTVTTSCVSDHLLRSMIMSASVLAGSIIA